MDSHNSMILAFVMQSVESPTAKVLQLAKAVICLLVSGFEEFWRSYVESIMTILLSCLSLQPMMENRCLRLESYDCRPAISDFGWSLPSGNPHCCFAVPEAALVCS